MLLVGLFMGLLWFVHPLPGMWAWLCLAACFGLMPLSYVGEVLSDFRLLLWPFATCACIICLGIALFGNKFLIIQKKKKKKKKDSAWASDDSAKVSFEQLLA